MALKHDLVKREGKARETRKRCYEGMSAVKGAKEAREKAKRLFVKTAQINPQCAWSVLTLIINFLYNFPISLLF